MTGPERSGEHPALEKSLRSAARMRAVVAVVAVEEVELPSSDAENVFASVASAAPFPSPSCLLETTSAATFHWT